MPQLNPAPWLTVLVLSWAIFLTILPMKMMAHEYPNDLLMQVADIAMMDPWSWPWF